MVVKLWLLKGLHVFIFISFPMSGAATNFMLHRRPSAKILASLPACPERLFVQTYMRVTSAVGCHFFHKYVRYSQITERKRVFRLLNVANTPICTCKEMKFHLSQQATGNVMKQVTNPVS